MFNVINRIEDNHEKSIVFFINKPTDIRFYIFGFYTKLKEYFEADYNIYFVGQEHKDNYTSFRNLWTLNKKTYDKLKPNLIKRADDPLNYITNIDIITNEFTSLDEIKNVKYFFIIDDSAFIMPLQSWDKRFSKMKNEFHDYVGDDDEVIAEINDATANVVHNIDSKMSLLAFSQYEKIIYLQAFKRIYENNKETLENFFGFVIDPIFFHPWFKKQDIPLRLLYFANDNRGTRDFEEFPIAHLQHIVTEKQYTNIKKTKDFIFAGTIIHDKGDRTKMWNRFLKNLKLDNSSLYIPLIRNGIINNKTVGVSNRIDKAKELYNDLFTEIFNHPMYSNYLTPDKVAAETKKYRYGFVMRCISTNDSLNFRPVFYLNLDVLPIFDVGYDPEFLQVPKRFQMLLTASDDNDIAEIVERYNKDDTTRLKLLAEMRDHFDIDNFKSNWKGKLDEFFKK